MWGDLEITTFRENYFYNARHISKNEKKNMRLSNSLFWSQALGYGATAGEGMEYMSSYRRHSRRLGPRRR